MVMLGHLATRADDYITTWRREIILSRARRDHSALIPAMYQDRIDRMYQTPYLYLKRLQPIFTQSKIERDFGAELLSSIFDYLDGDVESIHAVRLVCRTFEKNAWRVFAKSFNLRVFHPTMSSFANLQQLALKEDAVPYIRKLSISTVKDVRVLADKGQKKKVMAEAFSEDGYRMIWDAEQQLRTQLSSTLHTVFGRLVNLDSIYIVDGEQVYPSPPKPPVSGVFTTEGFRPDEAPAQPSTSEESFFNSAKGAALRSHQIGSRLYDRKAHRHTLEILKEALKLPFSKEKDCATFLPKLRSVTTIGHMVLPSLPLCHLRVKEENKPGNRLVPYEKTRMLQLTHLDLAITDEPTACNLDQKTASGDMRGYLPIFLASFPRLQDLTLRFVRIRLTRERTAPNRQILYGAAGFDILARSTYLPHLRNLHLVNLSVDPDTSLRTFLTTHRATLTKLKFTSVALTYVSWRPFVKWIGEEMALDAFTLATNMSPEEERICDERWALMPKGYEIQTEEFEKASRKGTRTVGANGRERVYVKKEKGKKKGGEGKEVEGEAVVD